MRAILLSSICFSLFVTMATAQIRVNEDEGIARLMAQYKYKCQQEQMVQGWRIQIINTDDRREMEAVRQKFISSYGEMYIDWIHIQPYYQVTVGAYRTKLELEGFLRALKKEYPRAIPIRAKIDKKEFIR